MISLQRLFQILLHEEEEEVVVVVVVEEEEEERGGENSMEFAWRSQQSEENAKILLLNISIYISVIRE